MSAKEIYGYGRKYKDIIKQQEYDLLSQKKELTAKEMLEKLGYIQDKEPRFSSIISYTKYCNDGCCRIYDLAFYKNRHTEISEEYLSLELLQAINKQVEDLGWNNE